MHPRHSAVVKFCGTLLVLLAVSPVTAPFSAWDPGVLYHDTKLQQAGAAQVKAAADGPVISPNGSATVFVPFEQWLRARAVIVARTPGQPVFDLPLRI
jgi:hypothetical protein